MAKVTVYFFKKHDVVTDESNVSRRRATLETITKWRGEAILDTALEVDETELDFEGFVARRTEPTGSVNGA